MPDADKRARAAYVIETVGLEETRNSVRQLLERVTKPDA
jgi:hypothetical protein